MDNATRYCFGIVIGMFIGMLFTMWVNIRLGAVHPLPSHRVSIDNDQHVYWCNEYEADK